MTFGAIIVKCLTRLSKKEGNAMRPLLSLVPPLAGLCLLVTTASHVVADPNDQYVWRFQFGSVCT
jgi:hypothetical protein